MDSAIRKNTASTLPPYPPYSLPPPILQISFLPLPIFLRKDSMEIKKRGGRVRGRGGKRWDDSWRERDQDDGGKNKGERDRIVV